MRGRVGCACKHLSGSAAVIEMPDILLIDLPLSVDSNAFDVFDENSPDTL